MTNSSFMFDPKSVDKGRALYYVREAKNRESKIVNMPEPPPSPIRREKTFQGFSSTPISPPAGQRPTYKRSNSFIKRALVKPVFKKLISSDQKFFTNCLDKPDIVNTAIRFKKINDQDLLVSAADQMVGLPGESSSVSRSIHEDEASHRTMTSLTTKKSKMANSKQLKLKDAKIWKSLETLNTIKSVETKHHSLNKFIARKLKKQDTDNQEALSSRKKFYKAARNSKPLPATPEAQGLQLQRTTSEFDHLTIQRSTLASPNESFSHHQVNLFSTYRSYGSVKTFSGAQGRNKSFDFEEKTLKR